MAKTTLFKGVVYLSQEQYNKLIALGAIEVDGNVIQYDESIVYVTPQALPDDYYTKEQTKELIKNQVVSGDEFIVVDEGKPGTINEGKIVVELDKTNIENEKAIENSDKLITSGAVFNSLQNVDTQIDNISITKNTEEKIQTIGVIDQNTGNANKEWTGTKAEYDALPEKDPNTFYNITDDNGGVVESIGGATGDITLGTGLSIENNVLSASGGGGKLYMHYISEQDKLFYCRYISSSPTVLTVDTFLTLLHQYPTSFIVDAKYGRHVSMGSTSFVYELFSDGTSLTVFTYTLTAESNDFGGETIITSVTSSTNYSNTAIHITDTVTQL